ncbi:hypothetical protein [Streptacidiphilus carbonis]|uniref:hypothetical protein n=1 Tax=Streptacidiphilus carbonis TaxID=105422 RepID=UPI0006942455|nr:hypothetical protein [Streptacidiphilus carbonis]
MSPRTGAAVPSDRSADRADERATDRATADPVHDLLVRHLALCETAVHPLEIAAELEAAGMGPGTAGRYRHSDVFSLAEELYARVPRRPEAHRAPPPESPWRRRAGPALLAAVLYLLPSAALWLARRTGGAGRGIGVDLTVVVLLALVAAGTAGGGPGAGGRRHSARSFGARFGYAAGVAAVLGLCATGGTDPAMAAALACGLGAADWCARWFRHIGWGHLGAARSRAGFRERMRPVLPVAVALFLTALSALTFAALTLHRPRTADGGLAAGVRGADGTAWAAQECVGAVLLVVVLLWRCGRTADALAGLLCGLSALGVAAAAVPAALPGGGGYGGSGATAGFATALLWGFGITAALLLPYAWVVLLRPESHRDLVE